MEMKRKRTAEFDHENFTPNDYMKELEKYKVKVSLK